MKQFFLGAGIALGASVLATGLTVVKIQKENTAELNECVETAHKATEFAKECDTTLDECVDVLTRCGNVLKQLVETVEQPRTI